MICIQSIFVISSWLLISISHLLLVLLIVARIIKVFLMLRLNVLLLVVSLILFLLESTLSLEVVAFLEHLLSGLRSIVKLKSGDLFVS